MQKRPDSVDISLTRRHFLEGCALTLGVALVGCNREGNSGPLTAVAQGSNFSLANTTMPAPGQAIAFNFPNSDPGLVFNTTSGIAGAVSAKCTHLGCTVEWNDSPDSQKAFRCPCHQSVFALNGAAVSGPAKKPLAKYAVRTENGGLILEPVK